MTCRMLVAAGNLPIKKILDDFKLIAQNKNEKEEHEYSNDRNFVHGDGWGIIIRKSGKLECYKEEFACWDVHSKFRDFYDVETDFLLLHARHASPNIPISYEFTHPFEENGWYFCHNGTVHDFIKKEKSDAQQLFELLLKNIKRCQNVIEAVRDTVKGIRKYSALNFILAKGDKAYILEMYKEKPKYYTMKYLVKENYAIISSERLPSFDGEWKEIENKTILVLDRMTQELSQIFLER